MRTKTKNFRSFYCRPRFLVALWLILFCFTQTKLRGQTYGHVAMGGGGFVSGVITCKTQQNLIYCRTDVGGAYRWDAASNKWIQLLDWVSEDETGYLGVESMAVDPSNPNNLYMLVGTDYFNGGKTAILRSTDKGANFAITEVTSLFKAHGNGMGRNTGEKLIVDPNKGTILFCGSRSNGLFKSINSGASWSRVTSLNVTTTPSGNGISFVVFDLSTGTSGNATQTLIVGVCQTGTNLYRSNDGGSTFTAISGAPTNLMPQRAAIASDRDLYITYANAAGPWDPNTGQIWKYSVSAGTWTNVTPSGYTNAFGGISVDPNNSERLVASTINTYAAQGGSWGDQIFITTNGGSSWTNVVSRGYSLNPNGVTWMNSSQSIHWAGSIEFDPFNTQKVYVISGNGVFSTNNIDATPCVWDFNVKGIEETVALDLVSVPGGPLVSVIGDYDGFRNTDINVYGPQNTPTMGTTNGLAVAALNTSKMVRTGSSLYYSTNTGSSWTQATINGSQGFVSLSADGNTLLHSPNSSSTTYRSTNNGSSWSTVSGLNFSDARTVADQVNSSKFYSYNPGTGRIYVSTNGGTSFAQAATIGGGGSKHIRTVPGNEGHIWVALYNGGLVRSTNSGTSFTSISNVTTCSGVGLGKAASGATYPTIYISGTVGGVRGIFRSTDQGASWTRINDDAHEWGGLGNGQFIVGDMNVYGRVFMSTVGLGVVYIESGGPSVPVTGVTVSPVTASVAVNGTTQLTATVLPSNATNKSVSWSSSNTSVATVSSSGLVTGVATGSATITVTTQDGGFTASCNVTVTAATNLTIVVRAVGKSAKEIIQLKVGGTVVNSWTLKRTMADYTATTSLSGEIRVEFTNDASRNDARIDYIIVNGTTYQAEDQAVNTGVLLNNQCGGSYSEWLNCNGYIIFSTAKSARLTSINENDFSNEVKIYPNPAIQGQFKVETQESSMMTINDMSGRIVFTKLLGESVNEINSNLNKGFYLIRIVNSQNTIFKKLEVK